LFYKLNFAYELAHPSLDSTKFILGSVLLEAEGLLGHQDVERIFVIELTLKHYAS
jgi:hypothetical protein